MTNASQCLRWLLVSAMAFSLVDCVQTRHLAPRLERSVVQTRTLNPYVLNAVHALAEKYSSMGYANQAFTHDLTFGTQGVLVASKKPLTMCVAAQLEVLVEALDLEAQVTQDYRAFAYLPKRSWQSLRPTDLRGQVWIVEAAASTGMGDALSNLGMGGKRSFEELLPGDFINFNRNNGTGHGAVFLGYIDTNGAEVAEFGPAVAGFKYFSAQGKADAGGLGYRDAFFVPECPAATLNRQKRDCGVIRSTSRRLLAGGTAWLPSVWDAAAKDAFLQSHQLRTEQEGSLDFDRFNGVTTDD